MDNNKKQKIVAIIISSLISLAVSIIACLLGVSPDTLTQCDADAIANQSIVCIVDD